MSKRSLRNAEKHKKKVSRRIPRPAQSRSQGNTAGARTRAKKAAGIASGSKVPNREKVGKVTKAQVREIAEIKMNDMNAIDIEGAMRQIEGTARNMGITVVEK